MLAKVEMQPLASIEEAKEYMLGSFRQFSSIVRSAETAKRYFGIAIHCLEQNPELMKCSRSSFRNALLESARLDLEPNSVQQLCWIIPRAKTARLEVGYRGLAQLVFRDGAVKKVWCMAVDKDDELIRKEGTEQVLIHHKANIHNDGHVSLMVAAYACAKLQNDEVMYRIMDRAELEAARKLSRSSAYDGPFAMEMYLKTPLKRLCKLLPLRSQTIGAHIAETIHLEDEHENIVPDPGEGLPLPHFTSTLKTSEAQPPEPVKETALPEETQEELKARIKRTWEYLAEMKVLPRLKLGAGESIEYYMGSGVSDSDRREFADYLAREMLKAERAARDKA